MQLLSFVKFCLFVLYSSLVSFYMNITTLSINIYVNLKKKLKGNLLAHLDIPITEGEKEEEL